MSDLISRSDLIKRIKGFTNISSEYFENPELLLDVIENQPTAYNVEKVVEELEKQAEQYRERGFETERKNVKVMVTMADRYYSKQCSYLHASEIVKRGGVDD